MDVGLVVRAAAVTLSVMLLDLQSTCTHSWWQWGYFGDDVIVLLASLHYHCP